MIISEKNMYFIIYERYILKNIYEYVYTNIYMYLFIFIFYSFIFYIIIFDSISNITFTEGIIAQNVAIC